jgi:hypothetical protein
MTSQNPSEISGKNPYEFSVTPDTPVDMIVDKYPKAVGWLVQKGIICVICGEPFWGTLGDLMKRKNIENPDQVIIELNEFIDSIK